jgi:hypothetical protein
MIDIVVLLATRMPKEKLVEQLSEALNEYNLVPSETNYDKLLLVCNMMLIKGLTNDDVSKGKQMISDVENIKTFMGAFKATN